MFTLAVRVYAWWLCTRSVWKFSRSALKLHAAEAYLRVQEAIAKGDLSQAEPVSRTC